jgi:hypothetical protein
MPQEPSPFPWWLWGLALLWAGVLVTWQRGALPRDWQRGLGLVLAVYTALLAVTAASGQSWTPARSWFWLAGGITVTAGLTLVLAESQGLRRSALWVAACGLSVLLVQLRADLAAAVLLLVGGVTAWRMGPAEARQPFGIPASDAWLTALGAMFLLVAWIGGVRHAVLVELHRPEYSRWVTALPAREQILRWMPERSHNRPVLEILLLAVVVAACAWRLQRTATTARESLP